MQVLIILFILALPFIAYGTGIVLIEFWNALKEKADKAFSSRKSEKARISRAKVECYNNYPMKKAG